MKLIKNICVCWLILFLCACRKDEPSVAPVQTVNTGSGAGVYIACEGNYGFGNAKISYYDFASGNSVIDIFQPANNRPLGDVCQSITFFNNKAYVVVNNSGKVEVCNPSTMKSSATMTGFNSPRYLLPITNSKAYVSDLYANAISIVDLNSNVKTGSIPCKGWTEQMVLLYGKVFVTNTYSDHLYIVNSVSDILTDSIQLSYGSNSIRQDKNGKLWVLCQGNSTTNIKAALHRINPVNNLVELSLQFSSSTDSPFRLNMNPTNDTLYYLNNGVCRMSVNDTILPPVFINQSGKNFYGLGIDPNSGYIYAADAIDYVQQGKVYRYKQNGSLINSFSVGIVPGEFYFR